MTFKLFRFLLCLFIIPVTAQTSRISGRISDDHGVVPFAHISITGSETGTASDVNGYFEITELLSGSYQLLITALGYKPQKLNIDLKAGENRFLKIQLHTDTENLNAVVVTGTMKPTYVSESPVKIDVITSRKLDNYLPSAGSSIMESVQLIPGVQEVVACGVCYTNSISINGLPGAYTAILMDGTPIYGNLASVYGLNGIPNMIIDRIEVIKGPSSTLYGSEAVAGVINIITKDPLTQPGLSIDIMETSHLETFGNLAFAPKIGKSSGYIGYNYAYIDHYEDDNQDGFGDAAALDRHSLFSKWDIFRKSGKRFTLGGKYYYEDRRNGVEDYLEDRAYKKIRGNDSIYGESIYTRRAELFGTYEFHTRLPLKADFSFSDHHQNSYYGSDLYEAQQQIAFINMIFNPAVKNHDIIIGGTLRYQEYDDNTIATSINNSNNPERQFIPGLFIQDEWKLNEKFTLLTGSRIDHYKEHGIIFSPRMNLKYKPSDWTTIRTNFGTGFRIVNLFTEDHAFITGQREVIIREELKPESSYNLSLNLNHIFNLFEGSGSIDMDAYYTRFRNKIIPDYDTEGYIIYGNTSGHAESSGIGLNINYSFMIPLSLNFGLNLQNTTQTNPNESGKMITEKIEFAPEWSGIINAGYNWKTHDLNFAYSLNITGNMSLPEITDLNANGEPLSTPRPTRSEPFALHNLQITKSFKNGLSLYSGVQNIFNYRQKISPLSGINDPNHAPGFSPYFDTSYAYSPIHGREYYIGIKWELY